jgi:hypothetical protein
MSNQARCGTSSAFDPTLSDSTVDTQRAADPPVAPMHLLKLDPANFSKAIQGKRGPITLALDRL